MRKKCLILAAALCLCFMPAGSCRADAEAQDSGEYVYDSGTAVPGDEGSDTGMAGYVYREGSPDGQEPGKTDKEDAGAGKEEDEESLQDIGMGLLNDNKINIAVLMFLLAALGAVLYRNGRLTAVRKR